MAILLIPEELRQFLSALAERTELRDAKGNSLGTFTPRKIAEDELYDWAIAEFKTKGLPSWPPPDDSKGFTIEEVLASLSKQEAM